MNATQSTMFSQVMTFPQVWQVVGGLIGFLASISPLDQCGLWAPVGYRMFIIHEVKHCSIIPIILHSSWTMSMRSH